jgi:hypothetical protein
VSSTRADPPLYIARASALALPTVLLAALLLHAPPRCPLATHFHLPCPGCGLTRAASSLLAGDLSASLHLQPLLVPLVLAISGLGIGFVVSTLVHGHPGGLVLSRPGRFVLGFAVVVAVANVLLWALRFAGFFGGPVAV